MISRTRWGSNTAIPVEIQKMIDKQEYSDLPPLGDTKFGPELLDEVIKEPTLDIYLDRSPKVGIPINYEEMVKILQRKRATFITAEQKKKEPKDEGEDT